MALPFFYEENISPKNSSFTLSEETSRHCVQVLRMKTGVELELTDGNGTIITAAIIKEDKRACQVKVVGGRQIEKQARNICIGISLLKNANRFEWFLEKATEIGASEITPLICARTERQHFRYDRMQNILVAAMLQSQQAWLPLLHEPLTLAELVDASMHEQKLVAHCIDTQKQGIAQLAIADDVMMLIGPEGDFTEDEINNCVQKGFIPVTLGNTRLRTETAGIVAATLLVNC